MMDLFTCPPAPADYVLVGGLRVVGRCRLTQSNPL
jgi:hypothetical protein